MAAQGSEWFARIPPLRCIAEDQQLHMGETVACLGGKSILRTHEVVSLQCLISVTCRERAFSDLDATLPFKIRSAEPLHPCSPPQNASGRSAMCEESRRIRGNNLLFWAISPIWNLCRAVLSLGIDNTVTQEQEPKGEDGRRGRRERMREASLGRS
jgi:hypothetical protein